jgi:hypothetical protein
MQKHAPECGLRWRSTAGEQPGDNAGQGVARAGGGQADIAAVTGPGSSFWIYDKGTSALHRHHRLQSRGRLLRCCKRVSYNTVHFEILIAAVKSIRTVGSGVRGRSG